MVYRVYWYDEKTSKQYDIAIKSSSDAIIKDFLQLIVSEFNCLFQTQDIDNYFFINDVNSLYELYCPDEIGRPDEEYPSYDEYQKLGKTNADTFALKITNQLVPDMMISEVLSDPQSQSLKSPVSEEEKPCNFGIQHYESTQTQTDQTFIDELPQQQFEEIKKKNNLLSWFCCCADNDN